MDLYILLFGAACVWFLLSWAISSIASRPTTISALVLLFVSAVVIWVLLTGEPA